MIATVPLLICLFGIGACPNGDFGRLRPGLTTDNIHYWVGQSAARDNDLEPSEYPLTDDERQLRDLAYPLIEPPFDRNRFYSIINEYGVSNFFSGWPQYDRLAYARELMVTPYRSATARYARLDTDIRNDVVRIPAFRDIACRVLDIDQKRAKSLGFVRVNGREHANAVARTNENRLIVEWVAMSLVDRAEAYQAALERLVVATPTPMAVEVERSLTLLRATTAASTCLPAAPASAPVRTPIVAK